MILNTQMPSLIIKKLGLGKNFLFLEKPKDYIKGTKMIYKGLKNQLIELI